MEEQDPVRTNAREPEPGRRAGRGSLWIWLVAVVLLAIVVTAYVNSYVPDYVQSEQATRQNLAVQ